MRINLPKLLSNPLSLIGSVIATVALGASIFALALDIFLPSHSPYQGILTFFVFPTFLFLGIFLVVVGGVLERRRLRRTAEDLTRFPVLDFNQPRQRRYWFVFGIASLVILLFSMLGAYRAYEFTDSVTFCGQLCHTVMEPEHEAYLRSPHARVKCVECHVGPGAGWYVKSKMSGLYQVYSVFAHKYPRPIPTPVHNLRPAQETCEQCHWPEKFWGAQLSSRKRFGYDPLNEPREILMLVKVGGGSPTHGPSEGIHWHMNIKNVIEYVARDERRMDIPWVQATALDGTVTVYTTDKDPLPEADLAKLERRRMDCMDCHTRPSHLYLSPEEGTDIALDEKGGLDPSLPYAKKAAVEALSGDFMPVDRTEALIGEKLGAFYRARYGDIPADISGKLPATAARLSTIYRQNFFPHMRARWSEYPNQIGHRLFPGCFRCHDGRHRSADGKKVLEKDCDACHSFLDRDPGGKGLVQVSSTSEFVHPFPVAAHFEKMQCWDCHTGGGPPYGTCGKCHEEESRPEGPMAFACSGCHRPGKVSVEKSDCRPCHDIEDAALHYQRPHRDCMSCHKAHDWQVSVPETCLGEGCHEDLKVDSHHPEKPCLECHDFRSVKSLRGLPEAARYRPAK